MILYPKIYLKDVKEITIELLDKNNIKGLILDVDNTLIDFDKNILSNLDAWANEMKKNNIKMCILSNTNKIEKVRKVADFLNIPFINFAKKPSKKGFFKAKQILNLEEKNIAVVGDQILTDVWGGNRCKMYTILTKPIDKRDILLTKIKRPIERVVINRYLKKEMRKK